MAVLMRPISKLVCSFKGLKHWGRNTKVFVTTEMLYGMPMQWVWFYQGIFMVYLGIDEILIGFTGTLPLLFQIFMPIVGGHLADKYGRKPILILFDAIAGAGAMLVWLTASDLWQAILAVALQALSVTTLGVREAMLIEDTGPDYRMSVYSSVTAIYLIGGILTPIAGTIIYFHGVLDGCRYIFLITFLSLTAMLLIRQTYLRKQSTRGHQISSTDEVTYGLDGYKKTFKLIASHKKLLALFVLTISGYMLFPLVNTFKPLYLTNPNALGINEGIASVIAATSSLPSLITLIIFPRLKRVHMKKALVISYASSLLSFVILIFATKGSLLLAIISAVLDSARYTAFYSVLRLLFVNKIYEVNPQAIVKVMSLVSTVSALVSFPVPTLGGYLYAVNPALPFAASAVLLALSIGLIFRI